MFGLALAGIVLQLGLSNPVTAPLTFAVTPLAAAGGGMAFMATPTAPAQVQVAPPVQAAPAPGN